MRQPLQLHAVENESLQVMKWITNALSSVRTSCPIVMLTAAVEQIKWATFGYAHRMLMVCVTRYVYLLMEFYSSKLRHHNDGLMS
ncbi:hypothetical protein CEXT_160341 [Caerostris extrusa]|uniref:Uncharacterized protein n=1 Tax=Caerostris extrusa TaxID=172846 RepID=A0AAV4WLN6_CAEEX|nr:hypothetical protein CEXT_160341 [Caerostris extrusa]